MDTKKKKNMDITKFSYFHCLAIPALVVLIVAVYILNIQPNHDWSGDFSHLIHHAKNLAEGRDFLDTKYLVNPASHFPGPYAYPPVFPIITVPVFWLFGLDLVAFKVTCVVFFGISLLLLSKLFRSSLTHNQLLLFILIIGLNPYFIYLRNSILNDFLFMLFSYASLILMQNVISKKDHPQDSIHFLSKEGIALGVLMYLSYGTREIGIILPLTFIFYEVVSIRRISLHVIVPIAIFFLLYSLQQTWLNRDLTPLEIKTNLSYLLNENVEENAIDHFHFISTDPAAILERLQGYRWAAQDFLPDTKSVTLNSINSIIFNLASVLMALGFFVRLSKKITVIEIFFFGYISVLLLFGAPATIRYLVPLFPFFIYYIFIAYKKFIFKRRGLSKILAAIFLSCVSIIYIIFYLSQDYSQLNNGVEHPKAKEVFNYIRENTDPDDMIMFEKPRVLALYTNRKTTPNLGKSYYEEEFLNNYFTVIKGDYYVTMNLHDWIFPLEETTEPTSKFVQVFKNSHFVIYRFNHD